MDPPADDMGDPPVVGMSTASGTNIRNSIKQYTFEYCDTIMCHIITVHLL